MSCKHAIKVGKFAGTNCTNNAHHNGFCWKHKKAAGPNEMVEAFGESAAKKKPIKYKFSAFRFTVNSNTSALKMTKDQVHEFKKLIGFIFDKENIAEYLVYKTATDPKTNLVDVQSAYHFEIAPTTHAVHVHGKLKHTGYYSMSIDTIRSVIDGVLGKKIHFNVKASGDSDLAWTQYIIKNQSADKF